MKKKKKKKSSVSDEGVLCWIDRFYFFHNPRSEDFIRCYYFFFFKQKTAYEILRSDWSSTCALPIYGALTGDHVRVVEGMDVSHALFCDQFFRVTGSLVKGIAMQNDAGAPRAHRIHLDLGCCAGHDNNGPYAHALRCHGQALGMVASGCRHHPAAALRLAQPVHFVVGPAQLEGEHGLQVLTLEPDPVAQPGRQQCGFVYRCLARHVVHAGIEDALDIAMRHGITLILESSW